MKNILIITILIVLLFSCNKELKGKLNPLGPSDPIDPNIKAEDYKKSIIYKEKALDNFLTFTKTGKNYVLVMLDMFQGLNTESIFHEVEGLKEKYEGFTYYKNIVTESATTPGGLPSILTGKNAVINSVKYDNKIIPTIINGYKFFLDTFMNANAKVDQFYPEEVNNVGNGDCEPLKEGRGNLYNCVDFNHDFINVWLKESGFKKDIHNYSSYVIHSYAMLKLMQNHGKATEDPQDRVKLFMTTFTHISINELGKNCEYDVGPMPKHPKMLSDADRCALIFLGNWLDWLKKSGVYDNTRIIFVSDHGAENTLDYATDKDGNKLDFSQFSDNMLTESKYNLQVPLLLVKDFNERYTMKTDDKNFMSNSDSAYFMLKDVPGSKNIKDPRSDDVQRGKDGKGRKIWSYHTGWYFDNDEDPDQKYYILQLYRITHDMLDKKNWEDCDWYNDDLSPWEDECYPIYH